MADKEKEAYWEGYNDEKSREEHHPNPLEELCCSSYRPPQGHEEAYKAGWEAAKRERD